MNQENKDPMQMPTQHSKYDTLFQRTQELNKNSIIKRKNCKLCNSKLRSESEQMWEDNRRYNISNIHKYLLQNEEDISFNAVKNHLEKHYAKQLNQMRLSEYADKFNKMMEYEWDKKENVRTLTAVTMNTLSEALSMDDNSHREQMHKIKAVNDTIKLLQDLTKFQHELDSELDQASVMQEKFTQVFDRLIKESKTDAEKRLLVEILQHFRSDKIQ